MPGKSDRPDLSDLLDTGFREAATADILAIGNVEGGAMSSQDDRIGQWEKKAEEYRTISEQCRHPLARRSFEKMAAQYERLAEQEERRLT